MQTSQILILSGLYQNMSMKTNAASGVMINLQKCLTPAKSLISGIV